MIEDAKIAFSSTAPLSEKWKAVSTILNEALFKKQKIELLIQQYEQMKKSFQLTALQDFKDRQKINFMNQYSDQIKSNTYSKEMLLDMMKVEEADKHGCYKFDGVEVYKLDCNMCGRHCRVKHG